MSPIPKSFPPGPDETTRKGPTGPHTPYPVDSDPAIDTHGPGSEPDLVQPRPDLPPPRL